MLELVSALAATGQVALDVIARRSQTEEYRRRAPSARVWSGASHRRPVRLLWEQTVFPWRLRGLAPALLHSPHYTMPAAARRLGGPPAVVTFHDATFFTHPTLHQP